MSTFTNWDGPQGGGVRAQDLVQLANAYSELVTKLNQHIGEAPEANDVHLIKEYISSVLSPILTRITNVESLADAAETAEHAAETYQTKIENLSDFVRSDALNSYVAKTELVTTLSEYLKTNDLSSQQIIAAIQSDIAAIEDALAADPFEKPVLKATEYIEGLVHAIEQIQFTFKDFGATVGGSNDRGVYYILGMLDERAGTAYLRFTNTKSFAAVVHFAITLDKDTGEYIDGQLNVTTDVDSADLHNVHFMIVQGTNEDGSHHAYLAIQADEWMKQIVESGVINAGIFDVIHFEGAGINFIPVDSVGYVRPNSSTEVLFDIEYFALENRIQDMENKVESLKGFKGVGAIVAWPKLNDSGVPTGFDANSYHICDGANIPDNPKYDKVRDIVGNKFPKVDYCVIQIRDVVDFD